MDGKREEMLLSLVRAIKCHFSRTEQYCPDFDNLFICTPRVKEKISKSKIFWLRAVSSEVCKIRCLLKKTVQQEKPRLMRSAVLALFFLFQRNFTVQQFMLAGTWQSQTSFTTFYPRNITHRNMATFSIGFMVAMRHVA